jgi:hypothetical protein
MEAASLKPEIPNPKKIQITKSQKRVNASFELGFENCLGFGTWDLLRIRSPGSRGRSPHLGIVSAFWFSFGVDAAAGIIGLRFCGARRQVGEHLVIGALRACGSIKFRKRGIVTEKRL